VPDDNDFDDVQAQLTRRLGADLAAEAVGRVSTVSLTLQISALVAGANAAAAAAPEESGSEADL